MAEEEKKDTPASPAPGFPILNNAADYTFLYRYVDALRAIVNKTGPVYDAIKIADPDIDLKVGSGKLSDINAALTNKQVVVAAGLSGMSKKDVDRISKHALLLGNKLGREQGIPTTSDVDKYKADYDKNQENKLQQSQVSVKEGKTALKKTRREKNKATAALILKSILWTAAAAVSLGLLGAFGLGVASVVGSAVTATFGLTSGMAIAGVAIGVIGGKWIISGVRKLFTAMGSSIKKSLTDRIEAKKRFKEAKKNFKLARANHKSNELSLRSDRIAAMSPLTAYPGNNLVSASEFATLNNPTFNMAQVAQEASNGPQQQPAFAQDANPVSNFEPQILQTNPQPLQTNPQAQVIFNGQPQQGGGQPRAEEVFVVTAGGNAEPQQQSAGGNGASQQRTREPKVEDEFELTQEEMDKIFVDTEKLLGKAKTKSGEQIKDALSQDDYATVEAAVRQTLTDLKRKVPSETIDYDIDFSVEQLAAIAKKTQELAEPFIRAKKPNEKALEIYSNIYDIVYWESRDAALSKEKKPCNIYAKNGMPIYIGNNNELFTGEGNSVIINNETGDIILDGGREVIDLNKKKTGSIADEVITYSANGVALYYDKQTKGLVYVNGEPAKLNDVGFALNPNGTVRVPTKDEMEQFNEVTAHSWTEEEKVAIDQIVESEAGDSEELADATYEEKFRMIQKAHKGKEKGALSQIQVVIDAMEEQTK